ncbi:hypothetical protein ETD83_21615 [Actinomadura soli]|uniref:Uncharacterized protein n=1 Tax=Actinomadura soli TaxID=2508997 RepID=A0A5C4JAK7_9ACTN|nr:hypothetical protein [Actinomadura soli]TMQ96169.1 hypothetical protein ETD83_21615 [Actinomadura soli]
MKDTYVSPAGEYGRSPEPAPPLGPGGARRRTRRWALASFTVLATATALVGTASSASAAPTGCSVVNGGNFAESRCTGGTGEHRALMRQQHFNPAVGVIACEGPWVAPGAVSRAPCAGYPVISVGVETR